MYIYVRKRKIDPMGKLQKGLLCTIIILANVRSRQILEAIYFPENFYQGLQGITALFNKKLIKCISPFKQFNYIYQQL